VNLVHLFNPQIIIFGGEITTNNPLLLQKVNQFVKERALTILYEDLQIQPSSLGKEFEMIGAASVLLQDKFQFKLTHPEEVVKG
ncbi:ROK family protein, partial [Micrococcus sp. SIMBA_144]